MNHKELNSAMNTRTISVGRSAGSSVLATNKVLRNTYLLLALTLGFSALTAMGSIALALPHPGLLITMVGYFGLLFLTTRFRNSSLGLLCVFALTGFMGYTLGPILSAYLSLPNGTQIVATAMGGTAAVFLGLSGYVLTTRKNFSFMGGFLMVGIIVAFLAGLGAIFFQMPGLSLAVSAMFVLLMSGMILFETSNIIHGGETNYIMATVSLYVSIYNLFLSLLHLLGFASSD
jgi:modulator of FtsH protease